MEGLFLNKFAVFGICNQAQAKTIVNTYLGYVVYIPTVQLKVWQEKGRRSLSARETAAPMFYCYDCICGTTV